MNKILGKFIIGTIVGVLSRENIDLKRFKGLLQALNIVF